MPVTPKKAADDLKVEKKEPVEEVFIPEEPKWSNALQPNSSAQHEGASRLRRDYHAARHDFL